MTFFRSQEVQRLCVLLGLTTAVAAAAGFCRDVWTGLAALGGSLAVAAVALLFTAWRYREMEKLAANLRRIAGGDYSLDVRDNEEGELSILKSELYKVTAMLSEYNERLRQEKVSLSDSMADISLTVLAMNGPQRRAHLYQVYMGTLETYGRMDILSAGYVDINDGVCLELPQKTLSVTVDNLGGRYDPETEYTTPTFRRFHTQALVRMYVDQEVCSIGRWFLDTYTVDETSVAFHFVGPLAVMNEYPHLWSSTEVKTTLQRVEEIVSPGLELMDVTTDKPVKSGAERYGITAECGEWVWLYNILRPSPPVSGAQALQLLCNYANNAILQGRTWLDPQNNHATADLHIVGMGWIGGQREIPYRLMLGTPKWQVEDAVGRIRAEVYSTGSETTNETLADQFWLSVGYDEAVTAEQPIASVTVPPGSGGYGTALRTAAFAYAWYYTAQDESYYTPSPVTAQLHKIIKTPVTAEYGEGTEKTLSNPLLSNSSESSSSVVTVQNYLQRMYNEIKHNLTATLSHRGYPELDAGELVMVQTKPEGEYVECRVLENRWTLNGGALSGSTKVRRLA